MPQRQCSTVVTSVMPKRCPPSFTHDLPKSSLMTAVPHFLTCLANRPSQARQPSPATAYQLAEQAFPAAITQVVHFLRRHTLALQLSAHFTTRHLPRTIVAPHRLCVKRTTKSWPQVKRPAHTRCASRSLSAALLVRMDSWFTNRWQPRLSWT